MLIEAYPMPEWAAKIEAETLGVVMLADDEKMRFAVDLAVKNVEYRTGGPFAAAIFEIATDRLVAIGLNVVVPAKQSWAHAEMTAFAHAEALRQSRSLTGCMLVTSCEPCAMCCGATPWSGVQKLLFGATTAMAERAGFDEGYKGECWREKFAAHGIEVAGPMLGEAAFAPFARYQELNGLIY